MKKKVLIINPYFLPGYKQGGPIQTVKNICETFHDVADIYLVTKNHDMNDSKLYNIKNNIWIKLYGINIMYVSDKFYGFGLFKKLYFSFENLYTCGLFCRNTYLLMIINRIYKRDRIKLYVAPMGVFSERAFSSKFIKKKIFIEFCKAAGLFRNIIWSFTSSAEYSEGRKILGEKTICDYIIAEDIPSKINIKEKFKVKNPNKLDIIFLSRICPKKNLLRCIEILNFEYLGDINLYIYGIIEDAGYWNQCKESAKNVPGNIHIHYKGDIQPQDVDKAFSQYDIFLFPTKGENYGHVIYEALACGCLPVISDTTPWKDFNDVGCGAVIDIEDITKFRMVIQAYLHMKNDEFEILKVNAVNYAKRKYADCVEFSGYNKVFL